MPRWLPNKILSAHVGLNRPDIIALVQKNIKNKYSLRKLNKTFIVYIPKKSNPQNVNNYRPISLCNVIYKIIAKVAANKLKKLLNKIIGLFQSEFVEGEAISNNYIIAHEVIHSFKWKRKEKTISLKLDIEKEYDRMECDFLQIVLEAFGFPKDFIKIIQECISSVSFSILLRFSLASLKFTFYYLKPVQNRH